MDDVPRRAGVLQERGEARCPLSLDGLGPARLVPLGTGAALFNQRLLQARHQFGVLTMRCRDDAQLPGECDGLVHLRIVHAEEILVREEYLERTDSIPYDLAELALCRV